MSDIQPHPFWDLVDAVLVINLDHRPERWERLQAEAKGLVPPGKLHRVSAVLGKSLPGFGQRPWFRGGKRDATWAARGGCTLAHRRALETARKEGWNTVLILEDDVGFAAETKAALVSLGEALARRSADWDMVYLGFTDPSGPFRRVEMFSPQHALDQVFGCNCAHAYLLKKNVRDWILARLPDEVTIWSWLASHRAVDRWYLRTMGQFFKMWAVSPNLVNQTPGFSDIVQKQTEDASVCHHVSVPARKPSGCAYAVATAVQSFRYRLGHLYDQLRGMVKRLRGF